MTTDKFRLFVAARVPEGSLAILDELVAPLRAKLSNARWTNPDNQHLTLKFLGWTPSDRLDAVVQTCKMVATGRRKSELSFTELGAFPSRSRIRVLWVGVKDPDRALASAAADLDGAFESIGIPAEGREYTPHLTLARFKIPVPLRSGFPSIDTSAVDPFGFDELTLFRSHLSPKGARYEAVDTFSLSPKASKGT